MADVLLGRTDGIEGFERHVVLKRIRAEHARDQRFISMFLDEARLAGSLHHQSIVQVFDIGESNGEYFFAMEYIHGEDLRRVLSTVAKARSHVPLGFACAIVSAAASALHYAHERRDSKGKPLGIVHRDVSPSNILIGYDGAVKVVDFGIAKATARQSETIAGSLKGKCSYMSPEQCKGEPVDRRSDVYGLGVLLYELATTARLFKGDNEYLVMDAIVNGKITLPQVRRPDLPNELSQIIMRALAVDPARRYQTADELRIEIDQLAAALYGTATTATLAGYMKKLFGVRPEPWLDLDSGPAIFVSGGGWGDTSSGDAGARHSPGSGQLLPKRVAASVTAQHAAAVVHETAPTQKFGWESARRMQAARKRTLPWLALPLVAVVGFGVWKVSGSDDDAGSSVASNPSSTPNAAAAKAPAVAASTPAQPATAPSAQQVATAEDAAAPPAADPAPAAPATAPVIPPPSDAAPTAMTVKHHKKPERARPDDAPASPRAEVATAPAASTPPAPTPPPTAAPTVTAAAAPAPAAPPAAPAVAAPATAPQPKVIDAPMPVLSNATVSAIASDHAGQLAKCESGALRGDVAVSFQIDASGKVVKSQVSSTIKNPKAAACILKAVQSWKFPKPPSGAAKGLYTISYQ